jgi:hypothetical protein
MMNSNLQHTEFSIEKIKNVVNVGRSSAYQIYTTPGEQIGYLGKLELPELNHSANDTNFTRESSRAVTGRTHASWLLKTVTAIVS